jgi:hypothetical protein
MPAIRREYNHLPVLLVGTHIDHRTPTIGCFTHDQVCTDHPTRYINFIYYIMLVFFFISSAVFSSTKCDV